MTRRARLGLFAVAGSVLLAVLLIGLRGLPAFGHWHGVYGLLVSRIEPSQRHATDIVTALNFDLRAFDTLGEEFILFASVAGVALLLRQLRDEDDAERSAGIEDHRFAGASDALRVTALVLIPVLIALGAYVVLHGQLTPGGGFQGGVILAAGPLAILLAGRYLALKRIAPSWALEALEALGASSYALIGLGGLIFAGVYLKNFLPLGTQGMLLSAGTMPLNSLAVGLEVTGAFLLTWTEFLDQDLLVQRGGGT
ncbi:MAG TPA: MnhB domain-containing protein [Solirubrobacteraceae bacterium]|nr:MnhB domain-containing protein [Solirubrobacteraceae bacterium]